MWALMRRPAGRLVPRLRALLVRLAMGLAVSPALSAAYAAPPSPTATTVLLPTAPVSPAALLAFKHDAWSIERGAPSRINAITQTGDGYLWIGSVEGLFRFDGVQFEPVRLEGDQGQRLVVSSLLATRSGDLWVGLGRSRGVARLHKGRLVDTHMPHPSREVNDLKEAPDGSIWVARGGRSTQMLARFHNGRWEEPEADAGLPAQPVWQLHFAKDGGFWVVMSGTLAFQAPGQTQFQLLEPGLSPRAGLSEDGQGRLWLSDATGLRALNAGASPDTTFRYPNAVGGSRVLFDREGHLWTTTFNSGVLRIQAPGQVLSPERNDGRRLASWQSSAGLTSDQTRALFQDREGNLWIGTELGLDLLRPASVVADPDLPANSPTSYRLAVTRDGVVHVANAHGLYAIAPGARPRRVMPLDSPAEALCDAGEQGVWLFLADRVLKVEPSGVTRLPKPVHGAAYGCAEDAQGRLWMPGLDQGLHAWQRGQWQRWPEAVPSPSLPANAARGPDGRVAVVFRGPPPAGATPFTALTVNGSAVGGIEGLLPTTTQLLVSGSLGLGLATDANEAAAAAAGMSGTGASANASASAIPAPQDTDLALPGTVHPWAASINGLTQTPAGDTWIIGDAGIVRVHTADLQAALKRPGAPLPVRVFDFKDGLDSFVQKAPGAQVVTGGDGRVWFLTRRHVMRIDPATLAPNRLPPPVLVRSVQVGETSWAAAPAPTLAALTLPAGTTTVRIDYTALSFPVPSRVMFRHRLLGPGHDPARWSEPRTDRSVVLQDLRPGHYRFEVLACNNDGVWSPAPATVALEVPATFTQSLAFKLVVTATAAALLYWLYLLRIRQILSRLRERSEDRSRERERIARDIHDTLLQSVQGLILRFHAALGRMQQEPALKQSLTQALDRAEAVVVEGRDRLQGLRRASGSDLEQEIRQLIAEHPFPATTRVEVGSAGQRRRLRPHVFDEVLCITGEALFNAARHSQATEVAVHIDYGPHCLTVQVHDNGVGMREKTAAFDAMHDHFGLLGMKERAARVSARLEINGEARPGTQVSLRIPARIAYARDSG
ncbi:sensor histidine kinase [Roseateles terrae]|uniref:Signal transduction histidine kinase/sugar lactone lactonase YvrE n=1 Tax=Roseateles terrae TaxID=431060 RepID=A0ABR6GSW8_9BURK|nr:sensor histidine kinase [Roseateles terrae]MBB3195210.1 signal transduction histidine kinase/sugar lactone lactonase YvrE [Roseateles terrae]